jgi:putative oxidoreductase
VNTILRSLITTNDSYIGTTLRIGLAIVILPHGLQKSLGMFGGAGFQESMRFLTTQVHIPGAMAFLLIVGESLGALSLLAGFLTRLCAASIGLIMLAAIQYVHREHGFFMNWSGQQQGEGYEYHLLALTIATALIIGGGGAWSVDRGIERARSTSD